MSDDSQSDDTQNKAPKTLLEQGFGSPGWHFDNVIEVAKSLNHPEIDDVVKLATQISEVS